MKSILFATVALAVLTTRVMAADDATQSPAASTYNWSGFYAGATAGYGWGDSKFQDAGVSDPFDIRGFIGGVAVGYNYQFHPDLVVGGEVDFSYSAIKGSFGPGKLGAWGCGPGACATDIDWYGTARARVGYAADTLLVYGTGGLAIGQVRSQIEGNPAYHVRHTNVGWAAGAGIEYTLDAHWTTKLEYLLIDLGWTNQPIEMKADAKFDAVRVGLNYRF